MMQSILSIVQEWLNLSLRWFHLIAGISWIGSSFYFMWLDSHLTPPDSSKPHVEGELWMVHSGGFYQVEKRKIGPGQMPKTLHWFKWEAMLTWMSGILLLAVVYYINGAAYLIDPGISNITPRMAILLSVSLFVIAWFVYDTLWQSKLGKNHSSAASAICFGLVVVLAYGLTHIFSGRAAFIHVGALFGTLMVANVWIRILPAQQQMIDATKLGKQPDFSLGMAAKKRSIHNSYMTFPVIFMMLSNHYPSTYGHPLNWLILCLLILVGAGIRHQMIQKAKNQPANWVLLPTGLLLLLVIVLTSNPSITLTGSTENTLPPLGPVTFASARAVIQTRCIACHSASPSDRVFKVAPNGVMFDSPDRIKTLAERIKFRAVISKTMPLSNKTGMTVQERQILGAWIDQGAHIE